MNTLLNHSEAFQVHRLQYWLLYPSH